VVERSTIYEVASRSGVSTATVSRVMDNGTGFSAATGERVRAVAAQLGWVPSGSARGLATRRTGIVGLLFPDFSDMGEAEQESPLYVDQVIRGAERAAAAGGNAVLIAATRGSTGRELAFSVAGKVDGLVVIARSVSDADLETLAGTVPVVALANRPARNTAVDRVGADNRAGMYQLVEHLIVDHGCHDFFFVGGPTRSPDAMERFAGFRAALRAHDLDAPARPDAIGNFTESGGARAISELLATGRVPDAIVCGNDEMAIGALAALKKAKVKVPGEVAVTGFDDIAATRHLAPPLTTVRQPMQNLGIEAVQAVVARLADRAAPRRAVVLPTQLVRRRSCGCRVRADRGTTPAQEGTAA
jgi:LacI family transcriptional regulator